MNSWTMSVYVEEIGSSYSFIVKESTIVSTIKVKLIEKINLKYDWSEFSLFNSSNNTWLIPSFTNLSNFGLNANSKILFIRRFRIVNIQLPDLQIRPILLDFSKTVYELTDIICKKLGIRHHEELSLQYRPMYFNTKSRFSNFRITKRLPAISTISHQNLNRSELSLKKPQKSYRSLTKNCSRQSDLPMSRSVSIQDNRLTLKNSKIHHISQNNTSTTFSESHSSYNQSINDSVNFESFENSVLAKSECKSYEQAVTEDNIEIFKSLSDRCNLGFPWLAADRNLMQQNIDDFYNCLLLLRFKYHNYFGLNEKYDEIRINQLFHQIRWSMLNGETVCNEDEALAMGGILLQVLQRGEGHNTLNIYGSKESLSEEINSMLDKMSLQLLGICDNEDSDVNDKIIEVKGSLQLIKYPRCLLDRYKKFVGEMKTDRIDLFKSDQSNVVETLPLKGNSVNYKIKLLEKDIFIMEILVLPNDAVDGLSTSTKSATSYEKVRLKFTEKQDLIKWMAACKLAAKGLDFRNSVNYNLEYQILSSMIDTKRPRCQRKFVEITKKDEQLELNDIIGPRFNKLLKRKWLLEQLIMFRNSFSQYSSVEAKLTYIKCWLTLNNAGIKYFSATINNTNKQFAVGIGYNRIELLQMEPDSRLRQMWSMSDLVSWNTNWEKWLCLLNFRKEEVNLKFDSLLDCQHFHEYIGGYLFIMMRNSENSHNLSKNLFMKLCART